MQVRVDQVYFAGRVGQGGGGKQRVEVELVVVRADAYLGVPGHTRHPLQANAGGRRRVAAIVVGADGDFVPQPAKRPCLFVNAYVAAVVGEK